MLVRYLDNAEVYVLDVRTEKDWKESEFKIKWAIREEPRNFNLWVQQYRDNLAYESNMDMKKSAKRLTVNLEL